MASVGRAGASLLFLALALLAAASSVVEAQLDTHRPPGEYQVKAAYLHSFGQFVEWPSMVPSPDSFVLCVLGEDPFGMRLDQVTDGATVNDVPVRVVRIAEVAESNACHTLFISASEDVRLGRTLEELGQRPVLTVSDAPQFAQRGGMIQFVLEGTRVRFIVNRPVAEWAGLTLRSELLRVASRVLTGSPQR